MWLINYKVAIVSPAYLLEGTNMKGYIEMGMGNKQE